MTDYQQQLKDAFTSTSIIGYCTSVSVVVYGVIAYFLLSRSHAAEQQASMDALWIKIIGGVGAAIFLGVGILRAQILKWNTPSELSVESVIKQLQSTALVIYGCCETISILGMVLAMLTQEMQNYYWMAFLSLVAFGTYFPKYERWDHFVQHSLHKI